MVLITHKGWVLYDLPLTCLPLVIGSITFDGVWMKYAPHAPFALRGVSFNVQSREKVGVVGRTGSGKSTLLLALYRMFNLEKGSIYMDNVDIASLTLVKLRRSLSVIPQVRLVLCCLAWESAVLFCCCFSVVLCCFLSTLLWCCYSVLPCCCSVPDYPPPPCSLSGASCLLRQHPCQL